MTLRTRYHDWRYPPHPHGHNGEFYVHPLEYATYDPHACPDCDRVCKATADGLFYCSDCGISF